MDSSAAVRPSWIFWALVAATIASGALLASLGDDGWNLGFFDPSLKIQLAIFLFVALGWVLSLTFHEFAHAYVAWRGGDHTVADKGYLRLDPRDYTDPGLSLFLPMAILMMGGIGLPGGAVWIQTGLIKSKMARSLMSFAGPLSNLVGAALVLFPLMSGMLDRDNYTALAVGLGFLGFLQITAFVLNMLPVPGLDGFGVIEPHLSREMTTRLRPLRGKALMILFGVMFFVPGASRPFWAVLWWVFELTGVERGLVAEGLDAFQFWN